MRIRTRTRRATASMTGLAAVMALGVAPVGVAGTPSADTVIRKPQVTVVLADGESGLKRPV